MTGRESEKQTEGEKERQKEIERVRHREVDVGSKLVVLGAGGLWCEVRQTHGHGVDVNDHEVE